MGYGEYGQDERNQYSCKSDGRNLILVLFAEAGRQAEH